MLRLFSNGHNIEEAATVLHVSPKTVANALSSIKSKLGARSHADIMRLAMEQGLGDEMPPSDPN